MLPLNLKIQSDQLLGAPSARLDRVLGELTAQSRSFLQQQIQAGHVLLNGKTVLKAGQLVRAGDEIQARWQAPEPRETLIPIPTDLKILFEDASLLVLDKPQGMVIHPAPSHQGPTLVHHLLSHLPETPETDEGFEERPGIVHRLDKGTSGVLLVAKSRAVQEALSAQFKARTVHKQYEALAWGRMLPEGRFASAIGRDRRNRLKMSSRTQKGRESITDWKTQTVFRHFTHVRLFPFTGRTHQLRVHLSEGGHPIVGDPLYGRGLTDVRRQDLAAEITEKLTGLEATLLHAARLEFHHPLTGAPMQFEAPRPEIFDSVLSELAKWDR